MYSSATSGLTKSNLFYRLNTAKRAVLSTIVQGLPALCYKKNLWIFVSYRKNNYLCKLVINTIINQNK